MQLFLVVVLLGGWLSGRLMGRAGLPAILGMVAWGVVLGAVPWVRAPAVMSELEPFLKSLALLVILLRAGLGLDRRRLAAAGWAVALVSVLPALFEGLVVAVLGVVFFGFSWPVAGMTGFLVAAVSPAVVVPAMLDFKARGWGMHKGIPTLVLAAASLDNILAIVLFSLLFGAAAPSAQGRLFPPLVEAPLSVVGGVLAGLLAGWVLTRVFRSRRHRLRATEKVLLLLAVGFLMLQGGAWLHFAATLAVLVAGAVVLERAEESAHEVASKLAKIWVFAEIVLFTLVGFGLRLEAVVAAGWRGPVLVVGGLVARSLGMLVAAGLAGLEAEERWFCVVVTWPKATVQAALGGVALAAGLPEGGVIQALAVLAIVMTTPLAAAIPWAGRRLLGVKAGVQKV